MLKGCFHQTHHRLFLESLTLSHSFTVDFHAEIGHTSTNADNCDKEYVDAQNNAAILIYV